MKTSGGEFYAKIAGAFQASLVCAHCGHGVDSQIDVYRRWLLKPSEKVAEAFDTDDLDDDIDVVACPKHINLETWIEDELLLSLPMFARHESCQEKIDNQALSDDVQNEALDTVKPFSQLGEMLAKVKKSN